MAEGTTQQQLEAVVPDIAVMSELAAASDVHGIILTARGHAGGRYDFVSRFFGPWVSGHSTL